MRFAGQRVFVSGGAGVIGDTLVRALHREGAEVLVGDLKPRPADWPADILYRQGDLNELQPWEVAAFGPTTFFHLAATFERSVESPEFWDENFRHNLRLSHHLAGLMRGAPGLRRVVFASSYLVYDPESYIFDRPANGPVRLREDDRLRPRNLCGGAKLIHELELDFLAHCAQKGFSAASARIFRSYGRGSRDVISRWVRSCLNGAAIEVFNPEGMFDYVYADDVAEGLLRLALSEVSGPLNLGRGRARRVSEVVDVLRRSFPGIELRSSHGESRFEASEADMDTFAASIGWAPATDLEEAIPRIVEHERGQAGARAAPLPFNVLITSVSQKISCVREVRRALRKLTADGRVHGADLDPDCLARGFVDAFWQMPRLEALSLETLLGYCREHGVRVVVPTRDGELAWFAERRDALAEAGVTVMVGPSETVDICLDKLRFARELQARGYPAIPAHQDAAAAGDRVVVKERYGAGSLGLGLDVSPAEAAAFAGRLQAPIFQRFVEGAEYSVDTFTAADGRTKGAIARRRVKVVRGESQVTTAVEAPELEAVCARAGEAIGLRGHAVWQVIKDADGGLHIVECNCRIGGASSLSIAMGLDSFYWAFCEAAGQDLAQHPFRRSPVNLRQTRIPHDLIEADPGL